MVKTKQLKKEWLVEQALNRLEEIRLGRKLEHRIMCNCGRLAIECEKASEGLMLIRKEATQEAKKDEIKKHEADLKQLIRISNVITITSGTPFIALENFIEHKQLQIKQLEKEVEKC